MRGPINSRLFLSLNINLWGNEELSMVSRASWVSDFSQLDFTNTLLVDLELQLAIGSDQ